MPTYQQQNSQQNQNNGPSSTSSGSESEEQSLVGNQAIIDIIQAQNHPTGERELNPNKNGIVFMGFNKYAHDEANKLNRLNRDAGGVRAVKIQEKQDHLTVGGTEYDLRTEEGSASFIATLGLPNQLAVTAAEFLQGTGDEARDEMA